MEKTIEFIKLLSITYENNYLILNLSSNIYIKMKIKDINIFLEDLDIPWPTVKNQNICNFYD